jgi:hypothetical protein
MINKIIQYSQYKQPKYVIKLIESKARDWEYSNFNDYDIIEFIKNNPIEYFNNSIELFNKIELNEHKIDFFKYYYLYLNGGLFINSKIKLEKNLNEIIKGYSFICVESLLNNSSFFSGFVYCEPKNVIIYECLKYIYNFYNNKNDTSDLYAFSKKLYEIYKSTKVPNNYKVYSERMFESQYSYTFDDNNDKLFSHHFKSSFIINNETFEPKYLKTPSNTKIGITFGLPDSLPALFNNGIRQNCLYFNEVLLNIGYDSYLIVEDKLLESINESDLNAMLYDGTFKIIRVSEILTSNLDLIFSFGFRIPEDILETLKYMKIKIVGYFCGNNYIIDSEKILYNQHKTSKGFQFFKENECYFDEIWSIPQMVNTNKHYWEILYRTKCIEVPFIWSPRSIDFTNKMNTTKINLQYSVKDKDEKKIAIFEPNISIMKWCLPSILICEESYRKLGNKIKHLYVTNVPNKDKPSTINEFNHNELNEFVKFLDLNKENRISIEGRYNTLYFMSKYADIVISHQWENPLNYLYLDLAWMGWPILHNAHLCKDIGYYYEEFDYKAGSQMLNYIINHHDDDDEYLIKNRKLIDRYLPSNKELQDRYKKLIDDLFMV